MLRLTLVCFVFLALFSCAENKPQDDYLRRAQALLATTPIVDTHIDFPWHLVEYKKWYKPGYTAFALKNPDGNFDWERAKKGGLYGPFMSIYIPADFQKEAGRSKQVADSLIDMVNAIIRTNLPLRRTPMTYWPISKKALFHSRWAWKTVRRWRKSKTWLTSTNEVSAT